MPTLPGLVIILISTLPWMCVAQLSSSSVWIKKRAMKFSGCAKCWKSSAQETPLGGQSALSFLSPTVGETKRGLGTTLGTSGSSCPPYPAEVSSVASYSSVGSIPNPRGLRQPSAPAERTRDPLWSVPLSAQQEAACTCSSMALGRSLPLAFIARVNGPLLAQLRTPR